MIESIRASASQGAAGVIARLTADVRGFAGGHPQHDDITLVVVRKT
jgi:serine phosphatase RsbU (regulator of sigma subunit)